MLDGRMRQAIALLQGVGLRCEYGVRCSLQLHCKARVRLGTPTTVRGRSSGLGWQGQSSVIPDCQGSEGGAVMAHGMRSLCQTRADTALRRSPARAHSPMTGGRPPCWMYAASCWVCNTRARVVWWSPCNRCQTEPAPEMPHPQKTDWKGRETRGAEAARHLIRRRVVDLLLHGHGRELGAADVGLVPAQMWPVM